MSSPEERLYKPLIDRNLKECNELINYGIDLENAIKNLFQFINPDDTDTEGNTLLHFAQKLHFSLTEELLKFGVDINAKNNKGKTVFCLLLENDNYDNKLADIYLSAGANINFQDKYGYTYLYNLLDDFFTQDNLYNNFKKVKFLLEKGADVNLKIYNKTPFSYFLESFIDCQSQKNIRIFDEMLKLLLKYNVDINETNQNGETPLFQVIKDRQSLELIQVLIDNGADFLKKDNYNNTALHFADDEDITKILLSKGLDPNAKNDNGDTPLHHSSVTERHFYTEFWFLSHNNRFNMLIDKYDVNLKNKQGDTILHNVLNFAVDIHNEYSYLNELLTLIKKGADINAENNDKETPLHVVFRDRCPIKNVVNFLISNGAHINSKSNEGKTPLHLAIDMYSKYVKIAKDDRYFGNKKEKERNVEICKESIQMLLDNGAEVDDDTSAKLRNLNFL